MLPKENRIDATVIDPPNGFRWVSTVLLCVPCPGGPFETMVFASDQDGHVTNWADLYMERYLTRELAEEGHRRIVEGVRAGTIELDDPIVPDFDSEDDA